MNVDTLRAAMPGLSTANAVSYLPLMEAAMRERGITSQLRSAMWLAQVGHESMSLMYFEELNSGQEYEGRVSLGNTQPGDGVKFKGRGPIQITGRTNYTQAGAALNLPLVTNPKMAADPQYAFRISAWWWYAHNINTFADRGDVIGATKVINGGTQGLSDRQYRYGLAIALGGAVVPSTQGDDSMSAQDVQDLKNYIDTQVAAIQQNINQAVKEIRSDTDSGNSIANVRSHQDSQGNALQQLIGLVKGIGKGTP